MTVGNEIEFGLTPVADPEVDAKPEYFYKSTLKSRFGLTDSLIAVLGEPDMFVRNPHSKWAAPAQLYQRDRVEAWVNEHQSLIAEANPRREAARRAVETKRERAHQAVSMMVRDLRMLPSPSKDELVEAARQHFAARYWDFDGEVTPRGLCAYIRHKLTNYEEILRLVKGKVGATDLYLDVKLYLCCRIIREYDLEVHPRCAAFKEDVPYDGRESVLQIEREVAERLGLHAECPA